MEVTLGGNRLGSGGQRKQELHNYNRATFNQEQDFKSSIAPGILYPFMCIPMTNGDTMNIDLDAFVRTLPTKGPLFGSFKLQADLFTVPMRLYQAILHNNPLNIGMNMNKVYFPKIELHYDDAAPRVTGATDYDWQVHNTSLLKYLGLSGIGTNIDTVSTEFTRKINAVPALAYYDIFKTYYANKQEENAYIITPGVEVEEAETKIEKINTISMNANYEDGDAIYIPIANIGESFRLYIEGVKELSNIVLDIFCGNNEESDTLDAWLNEELIKLTKKEYGYDIYIKQSEIRTYLGESDTDQIYVIFQVNTNRTTVTSDIHLEPFEIASIDKMRTKILAKATLGSEFVIKLNGTDWGGELPYGALISETENGINYNSFAQNGLVVKTYQSDLFNNWIQTDWIEGENGIAAISAVNVSDGMLEMDALNLAQKVYNMLNRVAISDGTWEGYQEAVWTVDAVRRAESPIYEGGMSAEIMFEEVIANTAALVDDEEQALGSLGGKGTMLGKEGGNDIEITAKEPIFVMGILSITPRICYTQGNEWYLTELDSYDDLHKPALDGIGFQDLITEQMAWWDTHINYDTITRYSAGKVVAWSNYQTAVDKAFGDFANPGGKGFMVLSRNYEIVKKSGKNRLGDCTTYIDPAKFNYAFAYTNLSAQNFWVQIHSKIHTRRVMSAHQIPNL